MTQSFTYVDFEKNIKAHIKTNSLIDATRYYDISFMEKEWQSIWTKTWLFAGLESDLSKSGDFFVFNIGRESILITRTENEEIRAFYNACQHRGNKIVNEEHGSVNKISCPYHGWTYDLDGKLKAVPDKERFTIKLPCSEKNLKEVRIGIWAGMIWINMDMEAMNFDSFIGLIKKRLEPYHFEKMLLIKHQTVSLEANWKTVRDNFLEQYHVDFIHPQHASIVDCHNSVNEMFPYGHSCSMVQGSITNSRYPVPEEVPDFLIPSLKGVGLNPKEFKGKVGEIRQILQKKKRKLGKEIGFDYSEFNDGQITDVWQYDIFPNTFMTIQAEELWIYGPSPHSFDPNKCSFTKWTLQVKDDLLIDKKRGINLVNRWDDSSANSQEKLLNGIRPEHEIYRREDILSGKYSMTPTIDQDIQYLNDMQSGLHSRGFKTAVLNEDEQRVQHFHNWLDYWIDSSS